MKNVENWLEEWIDNDSNQAKTKERAVIYYVARKSVSKNIIDVLVNYCSDKSLKIIKVYNIAVCSKRGLKKSLLNMLSFINTQKNRIHVVCYDFDDIFQDAGDLEILEPLITMGKITIHILKQNFIIDKNSYNTEMRVRIYFIMLSPLLSCSYYLRRIAKNRKKSISKS